MPNHPAHIIELANAIGSAAIGAPWTVDQYPNSLAAEQYIKVALAIEPIAAKIRFADSDVEKLIAERDAAETVADKLTSLILAEPIDWPFHDAKWAEAIEEGECLAELRNDKERLDWLERVRPGITYHRIGKTAEFGWSIWPSGTQTESLWHVTRPDVRAVIDSANHQTAKS